MKTSSNRFKEQKNGEYGTMSILALVFSIIFGPVGLILYSVAKSKEGDNELLKWALIVGIITTVLWGIGIIYWIWSYSFYWSFMWGFPGI